MAAFVMCNPCERKKPVDCKKENHMTDNQSIVTEIIALEQAALERWCSGDPSGFLDISAPDVAYFDPFLDHRLDGLNALTELYSKWSSTVKVDRWEFIDPRVQLCGDAAVLTFNFVSWTGETAHRWNCTEVYFQENGRWKIVQTHWSFTGVGTQKST